MYRVTLRRARELRLPRRCVVCGDPSSEDVGHVQDGVPIVIPGVVVFWSSMEVSWTYCAEHAREFRHRMRALRYWQTGFAVPGLILLLVAGVLSIPEDHDIWRLLRFFPDVGQFVVEGLVVSGTALLLVPAFTIFARRLFLDARLKVSRNRITVSARSKAFIEALREGQEPSSPSQAASRQPGEPGPADERSS